MGGHGMGTARWHFELVEEAEALPMLWRPPPDESDRTPDPIGAEMVYLLGAFQRLRQRGEGPATWAAPLSADPVAFLLDAMSDGVALWDAAGELLSCNRAAVEEGLWRSGTPGVERFALRGRRFER